MKWIISAGVLVGALILGSVISSAVRKALGRPKNTDALKSFAPAAGSLVFSVCVAAGLFGALSIVAPDAVKDLPKAVIAFVPKALLCIMLIILGSALGGIVGTAVVTSIEKASGKRQLQLGRLVKGVVTAVFAILGVSQLGVNTRIVDMLVAGTIFSAATTITLLTSLGGRATAAEIAAGRYVKRIFRVGDRLASEQVPSGSVIKAMHGASVVLETEAVDKTGFGSDGHGQADGGTANTTSFVHIPNTTLLGSVVHVTRPNDQSNS